MAEPSYSPKWISPPGETILDIINERKISKAQLSKYLEQSASKTDELIKGILQITEETAAILSKTLGASQSFWLDRERKYRSHLYRLATDRDEVACKAWLRELPLSEMIDWGWIKLKNTAVQQSRECLAFFGVENPLLWKEKYQCLTASAAFRTSLAFPAVFGATAAWLRQAEIQAAGSPCSTWNKAALIKNLPSIRKLTRTKSPAKFLPLLRNICADVGIALSVVPAPKGCRASGATFFVSPKTAVVCLSFRYLSDDHFWFTFFHEIGHLILHGDQKCFIEGTGDVSRAEDEANAFSAETLIPRENRKELADLGADSTKIIRYARKIGISPGIVVGQMQFAKMLKQSEMNRLKVRYTW